MKHIVRIIIDTNVFILGIFWSGHPYKILKGWQDRKIELIMSQEIMEEYKRVFEILSAKR